MVGNVHTDAADVCETKLGHVTFAYNRFRGVWTYLVNFGDAGVSHLKAKLLFIKVIEPVLDRVKKSWR